MNLAEVPANSKTGTEETALDELQGLNGSGKMAIDRSLFKYFSPELADSNQMMPVKILSKRRATLGETWLLQVAVGTSHVSDVRQHADYYAEQIRDAVPSYWPKWLQLSIVPTSHEEVKQRLNLIRQEWGLRTMEENLLREPQLHETTLPALAPIDPMEQAIATLHDAFKEATSTVISFTAGAETAMKDQQVIDLAETNQPINRRALYNVVNVAIMKGASDIHFEYMTNGMDFPTVAIRIRVDGVLQPLIETPSSLGPSILNILGKCAGSGVEESSFHMRPQDGKMIIYSKDRRRFDGRLSFLPVPVTGSSFTCVLRLLDSNQAFDFEKLDLSKRNREGLEWALGLDHGMVVLTGPTGSGKSSTIQACLRKLISPEIKVITIEDPVEYFLKGATQVQVNPKEPEMSFASILRSVLRQDPDAIFIGEIRDEETAKIAVKASLTGHLIFTTIHANSALEVIDRMVDLGVHRSLVASALSVVGAQRLVRRIVPERWEMAEMSIGEVEQRLRIRLVKDDQERRRTMKVPLLKPQFTHGDNDNYRGRIAVHQYQSFDENLKREIRSGASSHELFPLARKMGMRTLIEDALTKMREGHTSLEEISIALQGT